MEIKTLDYDFSICKVEDYSGVTLESEFCFLGKTDEECSLMAKNGIGIFAVSTYNTDYILTKRENFEKAVRLLKNAGYIVH